MKDYYIQFLFEVGHSLYQIQIFHILAHDFLFYFNLKINSGFKTADIASTNW